MRSGGARHALSLLRRRHISRLATSARRPARYCSRSSGVEIQRWRYRLRNSSATRSVNTTSGHNRTRWMGTRKIFMSHNAPRNYDGLGSRARFIALLSHRPARRGIPLRPPAPFRKLATRRFSMRANACLSLTAVTTSDHREMYVPLHKRLWFFLYFFLYSSFFPFYGVHVVEFRPLWNGNYFSMVRPATDAVIWIVREENTEIVRIIQTFLYITFIDGHSELRHFFLNRYEYLCIWIYVYDMFFLINMNIFYLCHIWEICDT